MLNKNLTILTICQVFSFTAPPITVFISGIVGLKISPIASLATLPTSLSIVGTAVFSFFAAKIMSKIGRKKGFILSSTYSSIASLLGAPSNEAILEYVDDNINPFFLPILLIILAAKKENTAVPTIDNDVGRVANDAIGEIFKPTIPLIKTVIGGAVNEKTWQIVKIVKFLLSIL